MSPSRATDSPHPPRGRSRCLSPPPALRRLSTRCGRRLGHPSARRRRLGRAPLRLPRRGGSTGNHGRGIPEQLDVRAAIDVVADDRPVIVAGYSFGADVALGDRSANQPLDHGRPGAVDLHRVRCRSRRPPQDTDRCCPRPVPAGGRAQLGGGSLEEHRRRRGGGADHFFHGAQRAIVDAIGAVLA